jgi:hypothetical protein
MNVCRSLQESLTSVRLNRLFEAFGGERAAIQSLEIAQAARHRAASRRSELYWVNPPSVVMPAAANRPRAIERVVKKTTACVAEPTVPKICSFPRW